MDVTQADKMDDMEPFFMIVAVIFGLILGSFANVMIYRVKRRRSIVSPASHCPSCDTPIGLLDNIPVASYVFLRGRCRACREPIAMRYPIIEVLSGLLFLWSFLRFGGAFQTVLAAAFLWVLLVLSAIDLDTKTLPNRIVYPAIGVTTFAAVAAELTIGPALPLLGDPGLVRAILSGYGASAFLFLVALLSPLVFGKEGMGMGDVKLAFLLGLYLGPHVFVALLFAFFVGSAGGILHIVRGGHRSDHIPFGPYLAFAAFLALAYGERVASWYLGLLRVS